MPVISQARDTLQGPIDFYKTIAGGDRNAIMKLLAPSIASVTERGQANRNNLMELGVRGSRRENAIGDQSKQDLSTINNSILGAQSGANDQLSQLAQLLFGSGTSLFNASTGASGNALQALLGNRQALNQNAATRASAVGNLISSGTGMFNF